MCVRTRSNLCATYYILCTCTRTNNGNKTFYFYWFARRCWLRRYWASYRLLRRRRRSHKILSFWTIFFTLDFFRAGQMVDRYENSTRAITIKSSFSDENETSHTLSANPFRNILYETCTFKVRKNPVGHFNSKMLRSIFGLFRCHRNKWEKKCLGKKPPTKTKHKMNFSKSVKRIIVHLRSSDEMLWDGETSKGKMIHLAQT